MTTRAKAKLNDLFDLPGMTEMPGLQNNTATRTIFLSSALKKPLKGIQNPETNVELGTNLEPEAEIFNRANSAFFTTNHVSSGLNASKAGKISKNNNRRVLRLSPESREILKLLKKNLRLTYDQQIQFLGQLVLYHELLPENIGLLLQERVRELRRFSVESSNQTAHASATANRSKKLNQSDNAALDRRHNQTSLAKQDLRLCKPLPLDSLLNTLEERCARLQEQVQTLTKAIDAKTELQLLNLELDSEYSDENRLPALA